MEKNNAWILKDKEKINQKIMLDNLAIEISKKFNIQKKEALSLIKNNTLEKLSDLKDEIEDTENKYFISVTHVPQEKENKWLNRAIYKYRHVFKILR